MDDTDHYARSRLNGLVGPAIDRNAHMREDEAWLASRRKSEASRYVPIHNLDNLVTGEGESLRAVFLAPHEAGLERAPGPAAASGATDEGEEPILLGTIDGYTYFAIDATAGDNDRRSRLSRLPGEFRSLRAIVHLLDDADAAILAYARAMVYWHRRHRYCGSCSAPTVSRSAGFLRICSNDRCKERHFPRTDPAIIVLVADETRCLLARKKEWSEQFYSTIAGYVEPGETVEDAVKREVREESAVALGKVSYQSSQPWPFPSSLMLGFRASPQSYELSVEQDELSDARWMSRQAIRLGLEEETLRLPPPVSIAFRLIESWYNEGTEPPLRTLVG
jgi:NAD+ diphosphatase